MSDASAERSRITLRVTGIEAEHLHDITVNDILAESVRAPMNAQGQPVVRLTGPFPPADFIDLNAPSITEAILRAEWASLWCQVNGRASWDSNPLVWVVRFERVDGAS